jgi:hypothetical protein
MVARKGGVLPRPFDLFAGPASRRLQDKIPQIIDLADFVAQS